MRVSHMMLRLLLRGYEIERGCVYKPPDSMFFAAKKRRHEMGWVENIPVSGYIGT